MLSLKASGILAASLFLTVVNVLYLGQRVHSRTREEVHSKTDNFTYEQYDYPYALRMSDDVADVSTIVEESMHYGLLDEDVNKQWLSTSPEGIGYVRLGDSDRLLCPSMFHQLHCLRLLQHALISTDREFPYSEHHLQHCLNYIRQMVLCTPDLTLEPAGMLARDFNLPANRVGMTHTCRDWEAVYGEVERNHREWKERTARENA